MKLLIKQLASDIIDDWLYFFDEIGFANNPDWSGCYCRFYHFKGTIKEWENQTKEENKKASTDLILSGQMHGFLAYLDNKPVGWCNINSRENLALMCWFTSRVSVIDVTHNVVFFGKEVDLCDTTGWESCRPTEAARRWRAWSVNSEPLAGKPVGDG